MKKTIVLFAVLGMFVFTASAQLSFGIKAGYNSSLSLKNLSDVTTGHYNLNSVNNEMSNGFQVGAFVRIGNKLYLQPELLYATQKTKYQLTVDDVTNQNPAETGSKYIKMSTVDVPVLVGVKLIDMKVFNLRAFAGPKFRLNAGSSLEWKNISSATVSDIKGDFKKANLGLEAGLGVDVLMFTLDARLNLINDLYKADWQTKPDFNSNIIISLGWKLF